MSNWREWDFEELHKRPRIGTVEILEPAPEPKLLRVTIHRHHSGPSPIMVVCIVVLAFMLWRLKFGPLLMAAALLGMLH